jgi:hypothetical protein
MKVLFFLKRKADLTPAAFRDHMENVHVRIAEKHFVHMMAGYSRCYLDADAMAATPLARGYDCISEWTLPSEETLERILAIVADPATAEEFSVDEERFLDRDATFMIKCPADGIVMSKTA